MDLELVGLMIGLFAVVLIPLTVSHIHDMKILKREEHEIRRLDRIAQIEQKYHVEISDKDLEMR